MTAPAFRSAVKLALPEPGAWHLVLAGRDGGVFGVKPYDRFVRGRRAGGAEVSLHPTQRTVTVLLPTVRGALVHPTRVQLGPVDDGPAWWIPLAGRIKALLQDPGAGECGPLLRHPRPELEGYALTWRCPRCGSAASSQLGEVCDGKPQACGACGCKVDLGVDVSATAAQVKLHVV